MAIALTPFEAMCGFRTIADIKRNITKFPELSTIIGPTGTVLLRKQLCPMFTNSSYFGAL